ncbi:MAG: DUF1573 domain-containing protein [Deltaproteobacteria bacterium]|nr:DUF1573 domain-containing protein [Deltaproteobacteria bacterium]
MSSPASKLVRIAVFSLLIASISAGCQRRQSPPSGAAAPASAPPPPAETGGPVIDFDSRVHDFGAVNEGAVLKHAFVVKNTGNAPLMLANVATSCGCTAAAPATDTIPPGGSAPIEVTFATRGRRGAGSKTIQVTCNDRLHPTSVLEIKYDIKQLFAFDPPYVRLTTARGRDRVEKIWLAGTLAQEAKPRIVKVEGGEGRVLATIFQSREKGQVRKGVQLKLKGGRQVSGQGHVTIATGLPDPAETLLRFQYSVE